MISVSLDCLPCHVQLLNLPRLFDPNVDRLPIEANAYQYLYDRQHDHHLIAFHTQSRAAEWVREHRNGFALSGRWCLPWYPYGRQSPPTMHVLAEFEIDCISLFHLTGQQWYHTTHERTVLLWLREWCRPADRDDLFAQLDVHITHATPIENGMRLRIQLRTTASPRDRDFMLRRWILPARQRTTRRNPRASISTAWAAPNHIAHVTDQVQEIEVPIRWLAVASVGPPEDARPPAPTIADLLLCNC